MGLDNGADEREADANTSGPRPAGVGAANELPEDAFPVRRVDADATVADVDGDAAFGASHRHPNRPVVIRILGGVLQQVPERAHEGLVIRPHLR